MHKFFELAPYNPNWPVIFTNTSEIIKMALGDEYIAIHHIGSTSIPGMLAKPKIDVIAVVKNLEIARERLENKDFRYRGEYNIPMRYFFRKRENINLNLHVYKEFHPEIELNLLFRDYLRKHPEVREEYSRLKLNLIQDSRSFNKKENSSFTNYTLRKGDFIRQVLKDAGFNRIRVLKCNDDSEWKAARYFRDKYFFKPHGVHDPYIWTFGRLEHAHLVLYKGVNIIGYPHVEFLPEAQSVLRIIVIEENMRGKNFGSEFLSLCEKWLKSLGYKSIYAKSEQTGIKFYLKNGYTEKAFKDPELYKADPNQISVGKAL